MTLHFSHMRFTEGRTFIDGPFGTCFLYLDTQPLVSVFLTRRRAFPARANGTITCTGT